MPEAMQAAFWGLVSGGALVLGAAVVYIVPIKKRLIAAIMAFGSGVLISALASIIPARNATSISVRASLAYA